MVLAASMDAKPGEHPARCGGPSRLLNSPLAAALGLTDAQKDQIKGILHDASPALKPLVEATVQEHRALRDVIHASPVDEAAIRAQAAKLAKVQADLDVQRAQIYQKIQKVLTPEQIQQIDRVRAAMEKKVDDRLSRWDGGTSAE